MAKKQMLGGNRLGAGGKRMVDTPEYGRSTHNLSYEIKTTSAVGTVVPVMGLVALPGDTWDIGIASLVTTSPTIGEYYGSFKQQVDVFQTPVGLYQADMYMNRMKIGMDMGKVKLPKLKLQGKVLELDKPLDSQHVHSSCILNYFGIRGIGSGTNSEGVLRREFQAVKWLIYHDVAKNYYCNKQEGYGYVIHNNMDEVTIGIDILTIYNADGIKSVEVAEVYNENQPEILLTEGCTCVIRMTINDGWEELDPSRITFNIGTRASSSLGGSIVNWLGSAIRADELWENWEYNEIAGTMTGSGYLGKRNYIRFYQQELDTRNQGQATSPKLVAYNLENIDRERIRILQNVGTGTQIYIGTEEPYSFLLEGDRIKGYSATSNQEGLVVKTYQADKYNNWVATEYLEGSNGINEISAIEVKDGKIYIEDINMASKVYTMLLNIAVGGGDVDAWQEANYGISRKSGVTNPMFMGGMSNELVFDEVISTAPSEGFPLGTLAGKSKLIGKKGGKISFRTSEISYVTAYLSYTPRIDYCQGNDWDNDLDSFADFHTPALGGIAFQNLMTDEMAFWDTKIEEGTGKVIKRTIGKVPAWTNYMTNVNQTKGNFADAMNQGWMVGNRYYEPVLDGSPIRIKDATTYVDPKKWNSQFADKRIDAQNIRTQLAFSIEVRRIMSAKVMPRTV